VEERVYPRPGERRAGRQGLEGLPPELLPLAWPESFGLVKARTREQWHSVGKCLALLALADNGRVEIRMSFPVLGGGVRLYPGSTGTASLSTMADEPAWYWQIVVDRVSRKPGTYWGYLQREEHVTAKAAEARGLAVARTRGSGLAKWTEWLPADGVRERTQDAVLGAAQRLEAFKTEYPRMWKRLFTTATPQLL
jgi:hypothetical protein